MSRIFSVNFNRSINDVHGATATLGSTASVSPAPRGMALKCNSLATDYITYGDIASINAIGTGAFSFVVGANVKGFLNHGSVYNFLLSKTNSYNSEGVSIIYSSSTIYLYILSSAITVANTFLNRDVLIVATRNLSGLCTFYIKGVSVGTPVTQTGSISSASNLGIGGYLSSSTPNANIYFSEVYNHCLSTQEIADLNARFQAQTIVSKPARGFTTAKPTGLRPKSVFNNSLAYNGTSSYTSLPTIPAFGTGDFSIVGKIRINASGGYIIWGAVGSFILTTNASKLYVSLRGGAGIGFSNTALQLNTDYSIGYTRSGTTGTFYLNGVADGMCTDGTNYITGILRLSNNTDVHNGSISMVRIFNYALSPTQIVSYSKPEYPIEWVDSGGGSETISNGSFTTSTDWALTQSDISGGKLNITATSSGDKAHTSTIGSVNYGYNKKYRLVYTITDYTSGNVYVKLGGYRGSTLRNSLGTYSEDVLINNSTSNYYMYIFGDVTAILSIDNISAIQLGCVLDLNADGMASATWVDKTNSLTATNSGTTFAFNDFLLAAYNCKSNNTVLTDISGNLRNGVVTNCINTKDGLLLSGINSKVYFGILGAPKSISFRFKPLSATCKIMEKAANSGLIFNNSGTLTAADFANIYVNGVAGTALTLNQWHNITLTSANSVTFAACTLGLNNATYGAFEIKDLRFWSNTLSAQQVKDYNNQFVKPVLVEDFSANSADGQSKTPVGWAKGSGIYTVDEITTPDPVLKTIKKGTKVLRCVTAGTIAIPSNTAYGTIEFDVFKGTDASLFDIWFINSKYNLTGSGYLVEFGAAENILTYKMTNGSAVGLNGTVVSYFTYNTWYRVKITRTTLGILTLYIKGGAFVPNSTYDGWTLVSVVGGSGSNPVTDTTHSVSSYITLDSRAGDKFGNLVISSGIKV